MNNLTKPVLLYFYDSQGALQYVLDSFKGLTFNREWTGVGDFRITLIVQKTTDVSTIKACSFVSINNDVRKFGVLGSVEEDYANGAHTVLITGTELKGLASKRIVLDNTTITKKYERVAYTLLNNNIINPSTAARNLSPLTQSYDSSQGTWPSDTIDYDAKYGTLADELKNLAETYEFGWTAEAVLTNGALTGIVWKIKQSLDRTLSQVTNEPLVLSFSDNTVDDLMYEDSINSTPNTAIVGGKGEGEGRKITVVGNANSGINRNEKFVEARNLDDDELADKGEQALSQYGTDEVSTITPSASLQNDYLSGNFDLGDTGTLRNFNKNLTLVKTTEIYEQNYCVCKFNFGQQTKTISSVLTSLTSNYKNLVKAEGGNAANQKSYHFTGVSSDSTSPSTFTTTVPKGKKIVSYTGCFYNSDGEPIPLNSYHSTVWRSFLRFNKGSTYYRIFCYVGTSFGSSCTLDITINYE